MDQLKKACYFYKKNRDYEFFMFQNSILLSSRSDLSDQSMIEGPWTDQ